MRIGDRITKISGQPASKLIVGVVPMAISVVGCTKLIFPRSIEITAQDGTVKTIQAQFLDAASKSFAVIEPDKTKPNSLLRLETKPTVFVVTKSGWIKNGSLEIAGHHQTKEGAVGLAEKIISYTQSKFYQYSPQNHSRSGLFYSEYKEAMQEQMTKRLQFGIEIEEYFLED